MIYTARQRKIMEDFKNEEYIYLSDFWKYYSSQLSISTAINKFLAGGYFIDAGNKFKIVR